MENNHKINKTELEILTLTSPLKETLWGSDYFHNTLHLTNNDSIGEMWSCSGYDTFSSIIKNGPFKNKSLDDVYKNNKDLFNNIKDINFPLLVKLISTKDKLSIQVHPDDKYAQEIEHYPSGKSECWLILNKSENSRLILGNNAKDKNDLINLVKNNQYDKLINEIKINIGDLYIVNPGTIHGIGKDLLILEIQQSCDITYRFYDYNRLDKNGNTRELHINKALDVVSIGKYNNEVININNYNKDKILENKYFILYKKDIKNEEIINTNNKFLIYTNLCKEKLVVNDKYEISYGESFISTSLASKVKLNGFGKVIISSVNFNNEIKNK